MKGEQGGDGESYTEGGGYLHHPEATCAFESDQLKAAVHGLPRQLAAGGSWTSFTMTFTNTTGNPLSEVQPFLLVSSAEDVDRPYWELDTEYRDAKTGKWKTFHDVEPKDLFGSFTVGPRSAITLQLRTRAVKNAEPGAGYALAAGDYRNGDGSCGSAKEAWYDFTILPASAKPTQPPTGKPGGAHLAATGSSSALPAIALAGGATMAVGAGTVIGVRRRKGMAGTGASDITV